jgi:hypothetical protein
VSETIKNMTDERIERSNVATAVMRLCRQWKPTIFVDTPGFGFGFGVMVSLDRFVGVSIMIAAWDFCIGFRRHDA